MPQGPVHRRCVYYISGFDPKGASHYHALYREQAARSSVATDLRIEVGQRKKSSSGNAAWMLQAGAGDAQTQTRTHYEFMRWDDIVRQHWPRSQWRLIRDVVATTGFNLRHGALYRMLRASWPPFIALFSPFLLLMAVIVGVPLAGGLAAASAWHLSGQWSVAALAASGAVAAVLLAARWLEKRLSMSWLMRSYAFTARQAQGAVPELTERINGHARLLIERATAATDDEILLIGHSSGTILAVSILAQALRLDPDLARRGPQISVMTLGQCMPMLGCLPHAQAFRDDLRLLGRTADICWIDFSAPPDGCSFALCDPLQACGVDLPGRLPDRPRLLSPRFVQMFDAPAYAALRRDKFRMHFQYLMAADKPASYDYFAITAGDQTLADRFAAHPSITDFKGLRWL